MKSEGIAAIKKKLNDLSLKEVKELCLRLAKYKTENKELLAYLLFESDDEEQYINTIKADLDEQFEDINQHSLYWAMKKLRKILRLLNKHIKFSGHKQTEVELLLYYCRKLKDTGIPIKNSTTLSNLYQRQISKAKKALEKLHEDLQYDYSTLLTEVDII